MILSDRSIRNEIESGRIGVDPYDPAMVQPSSIDVRLDHRFLVFRSHTRPVIDVRQDLTDLTEQVTATETEPFILHPGEFVLGATAEMFTLPDDIVGRVEGKSSLGRLGLLIHTTAGFVDAGFHGQLTLEFSNVATLPITLYPGMKIGQISFLRMDGPAEHPYGASPLGSKYAGQVGPTPSQYWKNCRT
ncbi:MAG: dCTP deaminase [Actinomycetota bacterium]